MTSITIVYKQNPIPLSIKLDSKDDAKTLMDDIIKQRKDPKINTLVISTPTQFGFIDPHEIASCMIAEI
jgi:hypothetical protein